MSPRGQAAKLYVGFCAFHFGCGIVAFASRNRALELKLELAKARPSLISCDFFQNLIYFEFDFFKLKRLITLDLFTMTLNEKATICLDQHQCSDSRLN